MRDLLLQTRVVVRSSNVKISRRRLADYVKTLHQKACRTVIFLHPTNQIIDLWRCRRCCRRQILNSLWLIWLVEWGKIIVLHVRHAFWYNVWCSQPNDNLKFSYLRFWRHREFHFLSRHEKHSSHASERALHLFYATWPTWNNRKTLKVKILMWRFRCSCRCSFLNSLLALSC